MADDYEGYINSKNTWFSKKYPNNKNDLIAYFSAEYGLDETIPIYSGGLGILSGDHLKSASDLGLPFVAVGLLYKNGYFHQKIDGYGNQHSIYKDIDLMNMPINPVKDKKGEDLNMRKIIVDNKFNNKKLQAFLQFNFNGLSSSMFFKTLRKVCCLMLALSVFVILSANNNVRAAHRNEPLSQC